MGIFRASILTLSVLTTLGLVVLGCDEAEPDRVFGAHTPALSAEELQGTWSFTAADTTRTYTFSADGTVTWAFTDADGTTTRTGQFQLNNSGLTMELQGETFGVPETEKIEQYVAVANGQLFFDPLFRTDGSGSGLDGTWSLESSSETWTDPTSEQRRVYNEETKKSLTVNGFDYVIVLDDAAYHGFEPDDDDERRFEEKGRIRLEGDKVFVMPTEVDGQPIAAEQQNEFFFGYRVGEAIVQCAEGDGRPNGGFERQS